MPNEAFLIAMRAQLLAYELEALGMDAANFERHHHHQTPAYDENAYGALRQEVLQFAERMKDLA